MGVITLPENWAPITSIWSLKSPSISKWTHLLCSSRHTPRRFDGLLNTTGWQLHRNMKWEECITRRSSTVSNLYIVDKANTMQRDGVVGELHTCYHVNIDFASAVSGDSVGCECDVSFGAMKWTHIFQSRDIAFPYVWVTVSTQLSYAPSALIKRTWLVVRNYDIRNVTAETTSFFRLETYIVFILYVYPSAYFHFTLW
jgi:hypothetical protein